MSDKPAAQKPAAPTPAPAAPAAVTPDDVAKAVADAKGWVKTFVRQELDLLQAGHSRQTRERMNP